MNPSLSKNIEKKILFLSLLISSCCFAGNVFAAEDTTVRKDTVDINVSTIDHNNWYDDRCTNKKDDDGDGLIDGADKKAPVCDGGETGLKPEVICDASSSESDGYLKIGGALPTDLSMTPCNKDGVHDDYYSTSVSNEAYVQPSEKNFTIKVNASDPSGIDTIKIEWISGVSLKREAGSYWIPAKLEEYRKADTTLNPHKTSFICSGENAGSCEICVVGGTCANPVIPTGDLGNTGSQQIIIFRAIITDGAMNTITTGFDDSNVSPVLDKFNRFVVCSTSCHTTIDCKNNNPEVVLVGYSHSDFCSNPIYTVKWKFKDQDSIDKPSTYIIEVRNRKNPSVVYSAVRSAGEVKCEKLGCQPCGTDEGVECEMSATLFNGFLEDPDGKLVNIELGNNTYDWRVEVYDNSSERNCIGISEWSSWSSDNKPSLSFTTPYPAPTVSFTMNNAAGEDCSAGKCNISENITFNSTSKADPNAGSLSYEWYIDDLWSVYDRKNPVSKTFFGGNEHQIRLTVKDGQGISCSKQDILKLQNADTPDEPDDEDDADRGNAGWNEIAPGRD